MVRCIDSSTSRCEKACLTSLALLSAIAFAGNPAKAILVIDTAGFENPVVSTDYSSIPANTYTGGPLQFTAANGESVEFSSTNDPEYYYSKSVANFTSTYGFDVNGIWSDMPMFGLNGRDGFMTFSFLGGAVKGAGGLMNYAPGQPGDLNLAALDVYGNILEEYNMSFSTGGAQGSGLSLYILRPTADIAALRIGSSYAGITALTFDRPAAPVPAPLPVLGAVAAFGASRRLRWRINKSAGIQAIQ